MNHDDTRKCNKVIIIRFMNKFFHRKNGNEYRHNVIIETFITHLQCSVGDAKYENIFKSVVWRVDKLPRFNEGKFPISVKQPTFIRLTL